MTDRLKKLGFASRTSRNPPQNTGSPTMPTVPGAAQGRPPSYPGYGAGQPAPLTSPQNNQRPSAPNPQGAPAAPYPHAPGHVPIGHPGAQQQMIPQGIPLAHNAGGMPQHHPPYYGQQPPRPDIQPSVAIPGARVAEVEGSNKSKAQLIVGIDFVSLQWAPLDGTCEADKKMH